MPTPQLNFESMLEFAEYEETLAKGFAFDEFKAELRRLIKHDGYVQLLATLDLEHKINAKAADDLAYKLLSAIQEKLFDTLK